MKDYWKVVQWMAFFVANCYGVKLSFAAMTYPSDVTLFAGLFGLIFLFLTDYMIIRRAWNKCSPTSKASGDPASPMNSKNEVPGDKS